MAKRTQTGRDSSRPSERRRPPASRRRMMQIAYTLPFERRHYMMFGLALGIILAGFVTLGFESITLGPILMVAGYCICIPLLLLWKSESKPDEEK